MKTPPESPKVKLAVLAAGALTMVALSGPAFAATPERLAPGSYLLKDGTTLVLADNGRMRMFSPEGARVNMKDGVAMETRGGKVIVMREDLNWKQLRRFGTLNPRWH